MNEHTHRVYNFSAGPSMLPVEVISEVKAELLDYGGTGMSVMEMSHRSQAFSRIINEAQRDLRELMQVPDDYAVMFLQGGATLQFSMVPLNLSQNGKADYVLTGSWANKAANEAAKFTNVGIAASSKEDGYTYIPDVKDWQVRDDADYVHVTLNNTIYGTRFSDIPDTGDVPLVADYSSAILSEEIDVGKFALIYAGAQKNIAPAGLTIVIARKDVIGLAKPNVPVYLDYKVHMDAESLYNTPPAFNIYFAGKVFKKLIDNGGLKAQRVLNEKKARMLYEYIDQSKLFRSPVRAKDRSLMNVVFVTGNAELDKQFIKQAALEGFVELAGHRSVGGMRASIYNSMPIQGVIGLIDFMKKFEETH